MSFRPKDLHAQISTLTSELELSTFLNKGVLQTNSEYKIRIVELERENAVLRIAESRLARTEDRLEAAEKRLREMDKAEREWEEEMQKELGLREVVERESDVWREKYERLKEGWDGTRSFMERVEGQVTMVRPVSLLWDRGDTKLMLLRTKW